MTAVGNSKPALSIIWASETALSAIRNSGVAVNALVSSPYTVYVSNTPNNLSNAIVTTKSILLKSRNTTGNDSYNLLTNYSNGSYVGYYYYSTNTSFTYQVVAFQNIYHASNSTSGYTWQAYIIDCD
jgi:hypothetical protein